SDDYSHTVKTVWQFSFDRLRSRDPLAAQILDICAFLQPDSIPVSFFENQYSALKIRFASSPSSSSNSKDGQQNRRAVRTAVAVLIKLSFVRRTLDGIDKD